MTTFSNYAMAQAIVRKMKLGYSPDAVYDEEGDRVLFEGLALHVYGFKQGSQDRQQFAIGPADHRERLSFDVPRISMAADKDFDKKFADLDKRLIVPAMIALKKRNEELAAKDAQVQKIVNFANKLNDQFPGMKAEGVDSYNGRFRYLANGGDVYIYGRIYVDPERFVIDHMGTAPVAMLEAFLNATKKVPIDA